MGKSWTPGMLGAKRITPRRKSRGPGVPRPMASPRTPASLSARSAASARASATRSPPSLGVGTTTLERSLFPSKTPAAILVP